MRTKNLKHAQHNISTTAYRESTLLSRADIAKMFSVTPQTVIRLEQAGKLTRIELGPGTVRYKLDDVLRYIETCTAVPSAIAV